MDKFIIHITADSGSTLPLVRPGISTEFDGEVILNTRSLPNALLYLTSPIEEAKGQPVESISENAGQLRAKLGNRYSGLKPRWVKAEIRKEHLGTGEITMRQPELRDIIRKRGIQTDHCGHIIASSLGGQMTDINLFPQNGNLNCGFKGNYFIWRTVETCIKLWVKAIPAEYQPKVKFQMLLYYGNSNHPDRPEKFKYALRFCMDKGSKKKNDEDDIVLTQEVLNIAEIALQCTSSKVKAVTDEIKVVIARVVSKHKHHFSDFLEEWVVILQDIGEPLVPPLPRPPPLSPSPPVVPSQPLVPSPPLPVKQSTFRHRPRSFWDFVPVVGSIKSLVDGFEDIEDGYSTSGLVNVAIGTVSLGLDIFTLGTISTIVNNVGGTVVKQAGKELVKETGKTVAQEAGKEIVQQTVRATAKQTVSSIVMRTGPPAVKAAGTYGASTATRLLGGVR